MSESTYNFLTALNERHVYELHALYQRECWTSGRNVADIKRMLEHSDLVFALCAQPEDRLVAFARVLTDRVFKALIFDVIVAPDRRGEGMGRRLMDHIVRHPDLEHVRHMELYCLPELVPFYEKWGFSTDISGVSLMRRRTDLLER